MRRTFSLDPRLRGDDTEKARLLIFFDLGVPEKGRVPTEIIKFSGAL